jgi:hypothetical protein
MTFDADADNLDDLSVGTLDAGVESTSVPEDEATADDPDFVRPTSRLASVSS